MSNDCIVCHKPLDAWFRGDICSNKCRKKKSRDRLELPIKAQKIGFEIDALARTIRLNKIPKQEAREMLHVIWRQLDGLIGLVDKMPDETEGNQ